MSSEFTHSSLAADVEFHFSTSDDGNIYPIDPSDKIIILPSQRQTFETSIVFQIKDKSDRLHDVYVRIPPAFFPSFLEALKLKEEIFPISKKANPSMRERLTAQGKLETSIHTLETNLPKNANSHFLIQFLKIELKSMLESENLQTY